MPPKKPVVKKPPARPGPTRPAPGSTRAKPGVNVKGKPGQKPGPPAKEVKKPKGPSKEELAVIKIQKYARRYLARKELHKLRNEKQEYDDLIEKLQNQAFVDMVNAERERADQEFQREQENRRKKAAAKKRIKRILEAAFDDEIDEMEKIVKECLRTCDDDGIDIDEVGMIKRDERVHSLIDCKDSNDNTPLSEAGAGGAVDAINWLIDKGANPNSVGQFGRTPLYRAAFAGHLDAIVALLNAGADPRTYAEDHNTPAEASANDTCVDTLTQWDIDKTENLIKLFTEKDESRLDRSKRRKQADIDTKQNNVQELERQLAAAQKAARKAYEELEKRITEHDTAAAAGFDRTDITETVIHQAEMDLEMARVRSDELQVKVQMARLACRDEEAKEEDLIGVKCTVRELDDVLVRDVGNKIKDSGRVVLLLETGRANQAGTFLRYRDTNYLIALSRKNMEPESIRLALLGSLRYGKVLIIDFDFMDLFAAIEQYFDDVKPGLFNAVLTGEIKQRDYYMSLVKPGDHKDYQTSGFNEHRMSHFRFVIYSRVNPNEEWFEKLYPIHVMPPSG